MLPQTIDGDHVSGFSLSPGRLSEAENKESGARKKKGEQKKDGSATKRSTKATVVRFEVVLVGRVESAVWWVKEKAQLSLLSTPGEASDTP